MAGSDDGVEAMKMPRYNINVFWSADDGCWIADVPDLGTCSAFGATRAEALAEVERAMTAWLEVAREDGKPIPRPRYRPAIYAAG
jgi:predicted RNase H-like HicB family nuclease